MKAAQQAMLEGIENDIKDRFAGKKVDIRTAYSGDRETGEAWRAEVQRYFPDYNIVLDSLPISISCHVGGGALGIGLAEIK